MRALLRLFLMYHQIIQDLVISEHADKITRSVQVRAPVVWFSFTLLDAPGLVYFFFTGRAVFQVPPPSYYHRMEL
jgi:hypothetical protein